MLLPALLQAVPVAAQSSAMSLVGMPAAPARPGGVVEARFGSTVPVLACDVLRACRVELQAGETLLSAPALGDSERWLTVQIATGPGGSVPVVVVKPTECGIATNLVLATDRRIYDVDLEAAPCRGAKPALVRAVRFAYSEEPEPAYAAAVEEEPTPSLAERASRAGNEGYRWTRRGGFPWEPVRVADDGAHVFVQLPPEAREGAAPVLYATEGGERTRLNYAVEGDLYVTDRLVQRSALVIGDGVLEIERRAPLRGLSLNRKDVAAFSAFGGMVAALLLGR